MPPTLTYPGVYVEEIPSGVRTITGVSTSVTALVGSARRGPIDRAVHVLSFADFERAFGGLASDSDLSYAVRQFFLNGGSDAWVIRLAKNAVAAQRTLLDANGRNALTLTAVDAGATGNDVEIRVDYATANPASTFNLTASYASPDNPAAARVETFQNLSMNSRDPRYAPDVVNGTSELITVARVVANGVLGGLGAGTSASGNLAAGGALADVATLVDPTHNELRVAVNGLPPTTVQLAAGDLGGANAAARLASLCAAVQAKVRAAAGGQAALSGFTCAPDASGNRIVLTSGAAGEASSVRVLAGQRNDAAARLLLGTPNGGVERDAVAEIRPVEVPDAATLTSGQFGNADLDALPDAGHTSFQIALGGYGPDVVSIGDTAAVGANLAAKLGDVAARIQAAVRALKPTNPAYSGFTCTADTTNRRLVLTSGARGAGSSVVASAAPQNSIADQLHLLAGATATTPTNTTLQGGTEQPYAPTDPEYYGLFIGNRAERKGIFALEAVDLFNLLCLPGVTDPGILADAAAYCQERRAFLVVDSPPDADRPDEMARAMAGTALPKTEYGAVYYPWVKVADPLNGGKLRAIPPSGTVAGLYARIDSARGVWKAPAGTEATLAGVQALQYLPTDPENGILNPRGVNCLRIFPSIGAVCWGARTLNGDDALASEYKYVPVRRLALYIEEDLYRGTKWVVFEPNDEPLWAQIRLNVGAFMQNLFRQGAFQGRTPREAYLVKCDAETTTQNDINLGIVNILVGFAPLKPAEFVVLRIQQLAGQVQA